MKIKTNELTGAALDWAVATVEFDKPAIHSGVVHAAEHYMPFSPATDWSQGGPIIDREKIDTFTEKQTYPESWCASVARHQNGQRLVGWRLHQYGPTPLIAAMRCYVASKLGDEIDLPADLALDCLIYETGEE